MNDEPITTQTPVQIPIDDATKEQLLQFAAENLGMNMHPNTGLGKVRANIRKAWSAPHIVLFNPVDRGPTDVEDLEATPSNSGQSENLTANIRALGGSSSKNDPKVRMIVNEQEGAGGKRPIYVGVNGVAMLIPRGEEVDVPYRYYLVLKAAVQTLFEQDDATHELNSRSVQSYPFQVVALPSQEEMEKWHQQEYEAQFPAGQAPARKKVA